MSFFVLSAPEAIIDDVIEYPEMVTVRTRCPSIDFSTDKSIR